MVRLLYDTLFKILYFSPPPQVRIKIETFTFKWFVESNTPRQSIYEHSRKRSKIYNACDINW